MSATQSREELLKSAEVEAAKLRSEGIDSSAARDDRDLIEAVHVLLKLGVSREELRGRDLADVASAALLRPNATIDSETIEAGDQKFGGRLRVALGFNPQEGGGGVTADEVETVSFFRQMADLLGEEEVLGLLRVMGSAASRVARAATSLLRLQFETPVAGGDEDVRLADLLAGYVDLVESALPRFLDANATILRSHFAQVVSMDRRWSVDQSGTAALEPKVVGFADLVGFTAFTEQADAGQFMRALAGFESDVQAAVIGNGGTLVKLIGDEVMFVAPDAGAALDIAVELSDVGRSFGSLDGMRVGLSSGEVINSGGDYFGTVVNIAARIVNLAFPHAIVATGAVAEQLRELGKSVKIESLGPHALRGIRAEVGLFRLWP